MKKREKKPQENKNKQQQKTQQTTNKKALKTELNVTHCNNYIRS